MRIRDAHAGELIRHNRDNRPVRKALSRIGILLGASAPEPAEELVLLDYIDQHLNDFAPDEFVIAFEMAMKNLLNVSTETYGKLTALLLQKVMNEYRKYRHDVLAMQQDEEQPEEWTENDLNLMYEMRLETIRQDYAEKGWAVFDFLLNIEGIYNYMKRSGKFTGMPFDREDVHEAAKRRWLHYVEQKRVSAKSMNDARPFNEILKAIKAGNEPKGM